MPTLFDPLTLLGERVHVYRNLHYTGRVWSVRHRRIVAGHATRVVVKDAAFRVGEEGQRRARLQQQRNVHAYVSGVVVGEPPSGRWERVTYSPFEHDTFVIAATAQPAITAAWVRFDADGCYILAG